VHVETRNLFDSAWLQPLKLKNDKLLSSVGFNLEVRPYTAARYGAGDRVDSHDDQSVEAVMDVDQSAGGVGGRKAGKAGASNGVITRHHRVFAAVLYLTPDWPAAAGGEFVDEEGPPAVYPPEFNTLALFEAGHRYTPPVRPDCLLVVYRYTPPVRPDCLLIVYQYTPPVRPDCLLIVYRYTPPVHPIYATGTANVLPNVPDFRWHVVSLTPLKRSLASARSPGDSLKDDDWKARRRLLLRVPVHCSGRALTMLARKLVRS
jgi:hypothetical protein